MWCLLIQLKTVVSYHGLCYLEINLLSGVFVFGLLFLFAWHCFGCFGCLSFLGFLVFRGSAVSGFSGVDCLGCVCFWLYSRGFSLSLSPTGAGMTGPLSGSVSDRESVENTTSVWGVLVCLCVVVAVCRLC